MVSFTFFRTAPRPSRGKEGASLAKRARALPYEALPGTRGSFSARPPPNASASDGGPHSPKEDSAQFLRQRQEEEKNFIRRYDTPEANVWYLVDCQWLQAWKAFVTRDGPLPGPISNNQLVDHAGHPRPNLKAAENYRGVNESIWTFWHARYGGGPIIRCGQLDIYAPSLELLPHPMPVAAPLSSPGAALAPVPAQRVSRRSDVPEVPAQEHAGIDEVHSNSTSSSGGRAKVSGSGRARDALRSVSTRLSRTINGGSMSTALSTASPPPPPVPATPSKLCCDKCDGPHATDRCPHFRGPREQHADAWSAYGRSRNAEEDTESAPIVWSAQVIRQPGDGSCLFHSLSYGLADRSSASSLRRDICDYIAKHPDMTIAETTLKDWIHYDSGGCVQSYVARMAGGTWGGGIEMAALTKMRHVNVHVYEKCGQGGFKRISAFGSPGARKTVSVVYQGRMHYDALVL